MGFNRPPCVDGLRNCVIYNYESNISAVKPFQETLVKTTGQTVPHPSDKASIIHAVEVARLLQLADAHAQSTSVASVAAPSVHSDERETTDRAPRVRIIYVMVVVQCIKKTPSMTSILHLKTAFRPRIERMVVGYLEVRVILDRYVEGCLQENTRKKRATYVAIATARHVVHDGMSINTTSLKQLLSCTSTKHSLTCYLGQG